MKKLFLFIAFLSLSFSFAQAPNNMVQVDMPDKENKYAETAEKALAMTDTKYAAKIESLTKFDAAFQVANKAFSEEIDWQEFKKEVAVASAEAARQTNLELGLKHPRMDSFNSEYAEPDLKRIIANFQVTSINDDKARIIVRGKKYEVSVAPEIDAGYVLQVDREYTICLERDMNLVYQFQTRGQNRTLPAKMIWFTVSKDQLLRDQVQLNKFVEEGPGYDRSPRY